MDLSPDELRMLEEYRRSKEQPAAEAAPTPASAFEVDENGDVIYTIPEGYHEHMLRICEDEFGNPLEDGPGQTVVKVALPEGESLIESSSFRIRGQQAEGDVNGWKGAIVGAKLPHGLPAVELLVDGHLIARGKWPHLRPVDDAAATP